MLSPWGAPLASSVAAGLGVVVGGLVIGCSIVCAMKGKWWVAGLGWVVPGVILAWPVCAFLVAKPGSFWARRWYDDYWMTKAEDRFSKHEDPELRDRLDAHRDEAAMSKKRIAVVAGLVAVLLVVGGIVAAVTPSSTQEFRKTFAKTLLSGCEEGKTPAPGFCRCLLAKTETRYSQAELESLEADLKRGASVPSRYRNLVDECASPKGKWDTADQNAVLAGCKEGKANAAALCHCLLVKSEAAYSFAEVDAVEKGQDARLRARFRAILNRFAAECVRHP
jgi:hypothetical protein